MNIFFQSLSAVPKYYAVRLCLVIAASVLLSLFDAGLLLVIKPLSDALINHTDANLFGLKVGLFELFVIAGSIVLTKNGLFIALAWYKNRLSFSIQEYFSSEILKNLIKFDDMSNKMDSGKKLSYVINEPLQVIVNVYLQLISLINEISLIFFISISLFIVSFSNSISLLIALSVLIGSFHWSTRRWLRVSGARRKDADGQRNDVVRSAIDAEVDLKAMHWVDRLLDLYHTPNRISAMMTANKAFTTDIVKNVIELAVVAAVAILVLIARADSVADMASLLAVFAVAAYRLMPSLNRLIVCSQSIRFGIPSLEVVREMLAVPEAPSPSPQVRDVSKEFRLTIDVRELISPTGNLLASDLLIDLQRGAFVAVTGTSGIGKSSLLKAIVNGSSGIAISLDGQPLCGGLANSPLSIGMVGQRPLVVPATLGYNVIPDYTLDDREGGHPLSPDEQYILHVLADRHGGSVIGEDVIEKGLAAHIAGSVLSGGQAQRVALMRALLCGKDLLILDEPTSALDVVTRDRFLRVLQEISSSRAVLVVSHDAKVLEVASEIVTLKAIK
jgi:ABC-type multidrug transport system fused ATPase/permease subunit